MTYPGKLNSVLIINKLRIKKLHQTLTHTVILANYKKKQQRNIFIEINDYINHPIYNS